MAAFLRMPKRPVSLERAELEIDGDLLPLMLKRNARARRMILRLDRKGRGVVLTIPTRASRQRALEFARSHSHWIRSRLSAVPKPVPFLPGAIIPLRGVPHEIRHTETLRGRVRLVQQEADAPGFVEVAGDPVHLSRRLRDWLKAESKKELLAASSAYAKAMAVTFHRISVRDQSSRWGSCSANGQLSYSWRLIFAPSFVLDYVAAHEVAHLAHMNHGAKFWALVARHCPDYQKARTWMKRHGKELHSYGV
jgi:predicted metal-dependent hydrolase